MFQQGTFISTHYQTFVSTHLHLCYWLNIKPPENQYSEICMYIQASPDIHGSGYLWFPAPPIILYLLKFCTKLKCVLLKHYTQKAYSKMNRQPAAEKGD